MPSTPEMFLTLHKPGEHWAEVPVEGNRTETFVTSCPTEVDLVRELNKDGIDLNDYDGKGTGDEKFLVVHWSRK